MMMNVINDNKNDPFIHTVNAHSPSPTWGMDQCYIVQKRVGSFTGIDLSDHTQLTQQQFTATECLSLYPNMFFQQIRSLHRLAFFTNSLFKTVKMIQGWLAANDDITNPVHRFKWPDSARQKKFRHMDRIIFWWSKKVRSLKQTGVELRTPQRFALTAFTAAQALDVVTTKPVQATL